MEIKPTLSSAFNPVVIFQNKKWSIEIAQTPNWPERLTLVVIRDATFTDFVMVYNDKRIAFDFPEQKPKYIIDKVARFAKQDLKELRLKHLVK
jgi:uncharacterized protein involved in propanediol utilization